MGTCTESVVKEFNISRAQQDEYAIGSYQKALKAFKDGGFWG